MTPPLRGWARWAAGSLLALGLTAAARAAETTTLPPPPETPPPPEPLPPPGTLAPGYGPRPLNPELPKPYSDPHRGPVLGASVGIGTFNYYGCGNVCGDAWMGELYAGALLAPGLALEADVWGGFHGFSDPRFGSGNSLTSLWTLAMQFWIGDTFWVKAGLGVGHIQSTNGNVGTVLRPESGIAFLLAVGINVHCTYRYTLDLQVRYGSTPYSDVDDNPNPVAALIGLSWR